MEPAAAFDAWAADGRDRGMERRHWRTAKQALARLPAESGETVLDLGCGSGYAARALRAVANLELALGLDGSPEMARNARSYTDDPRVAFVIGDFGSLPIGTESVDHVWSMEAFYYARDPAVTLSEIRRILRPGGTFLCAVNFWAENVHSHEWADRIDLPMTLWSEREYRRAFQEAEFAVTDQERIPDTEIEIPPPTAFPTEEWETREAMVERYREYGTLLTIGTVR